MVDDFLSFKISISGLYHTLIPYTWQVSQISFIFFIFTSFISGLNVVKLFCINTNSFLMSSWQKHNTMNLLFMLFFYFFFHPHIYYRANKVQGIQEILEDNNKKSKQCIQSFTEEKTVSQNYLYERVSDLLFSTVHLYNISHIMFSKCNYF